MKCGPALLRSLPQLADKKQPSLLEAHSSVPKLGTTKRCLYAKSMPDSAEAGHHIEVPVTRPCPDINEKAGDEEEDMKGLADEWLWMLKPRTGLVIAAKHAKCLSLVTSDI